MGSGRHVIAGLLLAGLAFLASAAPDRSAAADPFATSLRWILTTAAAPRSFPTDVAVDRRGVAFLLDSGTRTITLLTPAGERIREIHGAGRWKDPVSLAVSSDGTIFLADGEGSRVLEIDRSGAERREYLAGKGARVTGVAVFGDSIYCADNRNSRILVFRRGAGRTGAWGERGSGPGEFQSPFRIVADSTGRIFVSDVLNGRIQWFSAFGRHLGTLKAFGTAPGKFFRPTGIAVDLRGRIWVADSFTGLVQLFAEKGERIRVLSDRNGPLRFGDPVGVAVGPGEIWVTDQREGRVALFRNSEADERRRR
ncbi:MAG: hypothetical protein Kow00128_11400 [Deltaproteobacteria bacterium]